MDVKAYDYMDWPRIEAVVYGEEASPRDVMSPRLTPEGVLIQGFFPDAEKVEIESGGRTYPTEQEDEAGYFAALIPGRKIPAYKFLVTKDGETEEYADPYAFDGQITEDEEKAFCAGVYYHVYDKLGAHPVTVNGTKGVSFAVWAPNAVSVSVVGDFNKWDGRRHIMHRMPMSGIFELFVPEAKAGDLYKYEIKIKGGEVKWKTDPYGAAVECPPASASVVADLKKFTWDDDAWMKNRKKYGDRKQPLTILETDIHQWKDGGELAAHAKKLGYTHVELHPVTAYLDDAAGPYSTYGYYAVDRRFGLPEDFNRFVNELHKEEIGVILDWTPAAFPRTEGGLELFDGTPLYEIADPSAAVHPMWGTLLYNYESPMVLDFLIANAFYWLEVYHADGLRFDDVDAMLYLDYGREPGQWTPNIYGTNENLAALEFLKHLNSVVKKNIPGALLIAQEDGLWPELTESVEDDHPGFDYKWNQGWTKDFLDYLSRDPLERKEAHDQLTLSMIYAYSEHYILTLGTRDVGSLENFMERLPGNTAQKIAQVKAAYTYLTLHPGCKMTAPDREVTGELAAFIGDLNGLYRSHPALYEKDDDYDGFEWIQLMKYEENVLTFLRKTDKPEETILAVFNFAGIPYEKYQVGVPFHGKYKEIFNTDRKEYGGEGMTNPRVKTSRAEECDERENSIKITVPALGAAIFSCTPEEKKEKKTAVKKTAVKKTAAKKTAVKKETAVTKETAAKKAAAEKKKPAAKIAAVEKKEPAVKKAAAEKKEPTAKKAAAEKKATAAKNETTGGTKSVKKSAVESKTAKKNS